MKRVAAPNVPGGLSGRWTCLRAWIELDKLDTDRLVEIDAVDPWSRRGAGAWRSCRWPYFSSGRGRRRRRLLFGGNKLVADRVPRLDTEARSMPSTAAPAREVCAGSRGAARELDSPRRRLRPEGQCVLNSLGQP